MKKIIDSLNCISNQVFYKFSIVIIFLFLSSFSSGNKKIPIKYLYDTETLTTNYFHEKIYLHFDKLNYKTEEDIWFKIYLVDGDSHKPEAKSQIVYVELINPYNKIVDTRIVKVNEGFGEGDFTLSFDMTQGEYKVRAYTNYMKNFDDTCFFIRSVFVNSSQSNEVVNQISSADKNIDNKELTESKLHVQFFPEGGYMVNGFLNRIGFKIVDSSGKGVDLGGEIVDESNKKVKTFKTSKNGLGLFQLLPQQGSSFKANIVYKGVKLSYNLPVALEKGATMQIIEYKDYYRAIIQSSMPNGINNFNLIGKQNKEIVFSSQISSDKSKIVVKIPKNILEEGIIQFILIDKNDKTLLERMAFIETDKNRHIVNLTPSKKEYAKNEVIELEVTFDQIMKEKIFANMSIAVTDISVIQLSNYDLDIKTYLLLSSKIKGKIEEPDYYFNSDDPKRKENLDILMMTHEGRQFAVEDILEESNSKIKFLHEKGITLKGTVKSSYNHEKPIMARVSLSYKNDRELGYDEIKTDSLGQFIFRDLDFTTATSVIIEAKSFKIGKNSADNNFFIELDSFPPPQVASDLNLQDVSPHYKYDSNQIIKDFNSTLVKNGDLIELDEVVVKSRALKTKDRYSKKRTLYKNPSQTLDFESLQAMPNKNALAALQGRVPGLTFRNGNIYLRGNSTLRGDNSALILLDGIPIENASAIESIPTSEIDFIDVIKGSKAAIYGSRAANGVIAVYTLDGSNKANTSRNKSEKGVISFIHPGFSYPKKFYAPSYSVENAEHNKLDYSKTLYWKPNLQLESGERGVISFRSGNISSTYRVFIEGITSDGFPIRSEVFIDIR